jgi:hypothetical protein
MAGLSLDTSPEGDFVLRRETQDGATDSLSLTAIEVLTLADLAASLRQQATARMRETTGSTLSDMAVSATPIFDFQIGVEMLGENLLLFLKLGTSGSSTAAYALPLNLAERLALTIQQHFEQARREKQSRQ